jgi:hypothetical protein
MVEAREKAAPGVAELLHVGVEGVAIEGVQSAPATHPLGVQAAAR